MTNDELLAFKELAEIARPFTVEEAEQEDEEAATRRQVNSEFFLAATTKVPALIDELLTLRKEVLRTDPEQQPARRHKLILVLDFDGVLHSYTSGWKGAEIIPDPPVPGAQEFCKRALDHFTIWVVSSRCSQPGGSQAIVEWLIEHKFPMGIMVSGDGTKPAAFVTLDDRAVTFTGEWPEVEDLLNFKPWYK